MKYVLDMYENVEYWIEIDDTGNALRQIIIGNNDIQISCKTDCLAEGIIELEDLEGDIKLLDSNCFEKKWKSIINNFEASWGEQKSQYSIGQYVRGRIKYFYPQGVILQIDKVQGICDYEELKIWNENTILQPGQIVKGIVSGYDETNMWIKVRLM